MTKVSEVSERRKRRKKTHKLEKTYTRSGQLFNNIQKVREKKHSQTEQRGKR